MDFLAGGGGGGGGGARAPGLAALGGARGLSLEAVGRRSRQRHASPVAMAAEMRWVQWGSLRLTGQTRYTGSVVRRTGSLQIILHRLSPSCWPADEDFEEQEQYTWSILTKENWNKEAKLGWRYSSVELFRTAGAVAGGDSRRRAGPGGD